MKSSRGFYQSLGELEGRALELLLLHPVHEEELELDPSLKGEPIDPIADREMMRDIDSRNESGREPLSDQEQRQWHELVADALCLAKEARNEAQRLEIVAALANWTWDSELGGLTRPQALSAYMNSVFALLAESTSNLLDCLLPLEHVLWEAPEHGHHRNRRGHPGFEERDRMSAWYFLRRTELESTSRGDAMTELTEATAAEGPGARPMTRRHVRRILSEWVPKVQPDFDTAIRAASGDAAPGLTLKQKELARLLRTTLDEIKEASRPAAAP